MKKRKNNLDERQELKLLRIEHNGCWIAFWGLLIAMVVQLIAGIHGPENLAGEWIVFMCLALYLVIDCIKNGIWDRRMKPDFKTNLIASSIAAAVMGVVWFTISYRNYMNAPFRCSGEYRPTPHLHHLPLAHLSFAHRYQQENRLS